MNSEGLEVKAIQRSQPTLHREYQHYLVEFMENFKQRRKQKTTYIHTYDMFGACGDLNP